MIFISQEIFPQYSVWGGSCDGDLTKTFNGWVADVRLWKSFRNIGSITRSQYYNLRGDEQYLLAYWRCDQQIWNPEQLLDFTTNELHFSLPSETSTIAPWTSQSIAIHRIKPKLCDYEEVYDIDESLCKMPLKYIFEPKSSNTVALPITYLTDPMPQDFTFSVWLYVNSVTDSFQFEWENRFNLEIDSTPRALFTLLGSVDLLTSSTIILVSRWYQILFSYSMTQQQLTSYIYNHDDQTEILFLDEVKVHDFDLDDTGLLNIDSGTCSVYLRDIRLYSQYFEKESLQFPILTR